MLQELTQCSAQSKPFVVQKVFYQCCPPSLFYCKSCNIWCFFSLKPQLLESWDYVKIIYFFQSNYLALMFMEKMCLWWKCATSTSQVLTETKKNKWIKIYCVPTRSIIWLSNAYFTFFYCLNLLLNTKSLVWQNPRQCYVILNTICVYLTNFIHRAIPIMSIHFWIWLLLNRLGERVYCKHNAKVERDKEIILKLKACMRGKAFRIIFLEKFDLENSGVWAIPKCLLAKLP